MRFAPLTKFGFLLPLCAGVLLLGCSGDSTSADDEAGETTAAEGTDTASDTTDDSNDDDTSSSTTGPDEGDFVPSDDTATDDSTTPGNLGDMCSTDADCAEDLFCNGVPMLGFAVCSECASDTDCADGGNCTLTPNGYFECGDGSAGQMCETDSACGDGLYCAEVVNLGGLFNGNFCSECKDDTMCPDGQLCAPHVEFMDLMNIGGQRNCVDPGTVPNDQVCDHEGNGDEACEGFCTAADIMGLIEIGVCGECESDADCMGGATCMPATLGFDGVAGSSCG